MNNVENEWYAKDISKKRRIINKLKKLGGLLARDKELDVLFKHIYEDNIAGKISDERFSRMAQKYEQEQGEVAAKIKALRKALRKEGGQTMTATLFLEMIRQYTDVRELTQRMVTELIDHIVARGEGGRRDPPAVVIYISLSARFSPPSTRTSLRPPS